MRPVALATLLLLVGGAALLELLALERRGGAARDFSATLEQAQVSSSARGFGTRFSAAALKLGVGSLVAYEPAGMLNLGSGDYAFSAERLLSDDASVALVLEGDVQFSKDEVVLGSTRAVISQDGVISGAEPRARLGANRAAATAFTLDGAGELSLAGAFRATLFQ